MSPTAHVRECRLECRTVADQIPPPSPGRYARVLRSPSTIEPKEIAAAAAVLAERKKGVDIRVYDVSEHIKVADYFVLISGLSRPHVKALYEEIHVGLKALGERHLRAAEGAALGWWVLLDYVDVVVHILQPEARQYYDLDGLYRECPELDVRKVALPDLDARLGRGAARGRDVTPTARVAE